MAIPLYGTFSKFSQDDKQLTPTPSVKTTEITSPYYGVFSKIGQEVTVQKKSYPTLPVTPQIQISEANTLDTWKKIAEDFTISAKSTLSSFFGKKEVISPIQEPSVQKPIAPVAKSEKSTARKVAEVLFPAIKDPQQEIEKVQKYLQDNYDSTITKTLAFVQKKVEEDFVKRPAVYGFTKRLTQTFIGNTKSFDEYWNTETFAPKDFWGETQATIGEILAGVATMYYGGQGLRAIGAARATLPILFTSIGQLSQPVGTTVQDRIKRFSNDLITAWLFGKVPLTYKGAIPAGFLLYGSAVVDKLTKGMPPKQALETSWTAGIIGALFHTTNVAYRQLTSAKFLERGETLTPADIRNRADGSSIPPKSKAAFRKIADQAEAMGKDVKIEVIASQESLAAKVVGKGIVESITGKPQEIKLKSGEGTDYILRVEYVDAKGKLPGEAGKPGEAKVSAEPKRIAEQAGVKETPLPSPVEQKIQKPAIKAEVTPVKPVRERIEPPEAPIAGIPKELEPLAQEARKYKNAEEFVKSQTPVFRGGEKLDVLRGFKQGISVSLSKTIAGEFAQEVGKGGTIEEFYIKPEAKIATVKDAAIIAREVFPNASPEMALESLKLHLGVETPSPILNAFRNAGFDAIDYGDISPVFAEKEIRILNPDILKTKSQLTDFYSQVTKGVGGIVKTGNVNEIINKIATGSELPGGRGIQGMKLNEGELKTLMGYTKGLQTPENQKWAGTIYKTWTGDKDLVIGVVKEADGGNSFLVTSYGNKHPEYKGVLRLHRTPISEKDIVGSFRGVVAKESSQGVKEPTVYGFNPKNLEDPESPKAAKEVEKIVKKSEIAKELSEKLGVPIRRGKFNQRALGIFKQQPKVVRIKKGGLQTVFHEVGHFLDDQFNFSRDISVAERKSLLTEYATKYEGQTDKQRKEAFSEFLRFKMSGQDAKAEKFAPEFSKIFDTRMKELPEIKEVIDTATRDFKRWMNQPATAKILSHISIGTQNKRSLLDKVNTSLHDFYTAALDDLHPLEEFSRIAKKKLGPINATRDPYILARNLRGWAGKADLFLTKGTFGREFWSVDEKGKTKMNFTGKSYSEIMRPIEKTGKMDEFRVYIVSKRAIELSDRGIVTGITRKDAEDALVELSQKYPEFEKIAQERLAYKDALLKYAAEPSSGLLGQEALTRIKALNKFHVPFYRVMEEVAGGGFMGRRKMAGNLGSPIKRIKGSEREIIDPLESDIKDTYAIINAVERNSIGIAMANLSAENFELGRLFEKVDRPMKGVKVNAKEVMEKVLKESDAEIEVPEDLADIVVTIFRPTMDIGPNMLNVNMGDRKMVFQVDPMLFKSIQGLNAEDSGLIMRLLSLPAHILRAGATLTPDFSLRNPIRDQFSAFIYSRSGYTPGFDLLRGMFELFKQGDVYNLWRAGGGERAMLVSMDRKYMQKNLTVLLHENKAKVLRYIKNPLELLQTLSEIGEQATRLGEMKRALTKGKNPVQGAFDSREVTLDFSRIGAKTKAVNMLVAFWNANVQGTDKLIRSFKTRPYQTLFKTLMGITLPSILLYFANRNDERWKEIPAWQKDLFWIVFTKDNIWRIPKPFEVGILFGSVPERVLEFMDNKDPKIFDQLQADVANGATPGFIPTTLLPIIENISNYSFFLDRPIVSRGKEGLPPEAQHGPYTTEISKIIGSALRYSPAKIENLILGYTGGLGRYALSIIDKVLTGTGAVKIPPRPAPSLSDLPIIKAFVVRDPEGVKAH